MSSLFKNHFILIAAILVFSSISGYSTGAFDGIGNADHYCTRVCGNSMYPTLKNGDMAMVNKTYPYKKLRIGDVVIIRSERKLSVIHRIVARYRGGMWVTKGDNNAKMDREVLCAHNFQGLALLDKSTLNS